MKTIDKTGVLLRDYQQTLVQDIYRAWSDGNRKVLAQLPTGAGKTICFAQIAKDFVQKQGRVLVLTHRKELIEQSANKIREATGLDVGIVKAGIKPDYSALVQVASVQSLGSRMDNLDSVSLVVCDEAQHSIAKSWRAILSQFPNQYILGVTATPVRLDGSGFIDQYDILIQGASVSELISSGVLSNYRLYAAPTAMDTTSVKKQGGDYSISELAERNSAIELSGHLIDSYRRHADGLQAIVFAINVEHSKAIADRYNQAGITAAHLDGRTPDKVRTETIAAFRRGEIRVLANCNLFDEGFDLPSLGCVQIARPTQSLGKYLQMLGRGARPEKGKDCAIYIDHTQNYLIHGLPDADREWSLDGVKSVLSPIGMAEDREIVEIMEEEGGGGGSKRQKAIIELVYVVLERVPKIKLPPDIAERYQAGISISKLAKETGFGYGVIKRYIRSCGIEIRTPNAKKEMPENIVERYNVDPNAAKIARELGCSKSVVYSHLRSKGVEIVTGKTLPEDIVDGYISGRSTVELAKELGCSDITVANHLRKRGVNVAPRKKFEAFPQDTVEMYRLNPCIRKLSKDLGCPLGALTDYLRSRGVPTNLNPRARKNLPDDIAERYEANPNVAALAREIGVTAPTLARHLRGLGVSVNNPVPKRHFPSDLAERYTLDPSVAKLAREFKCCRETVSRHLRSLGIDTSKKPKSSREGNNP
jgi:superfamily II DNA or RNA helicase/AraC-like DNA-binding protein